MAFETYLVRCQPQCDVEMIKSVAVYIRSLNGLILMATRQGAIVAAFDDSLRDLVKKYRGVEFIGGVTLDPRGAAAQELHRIFVEHLGLQAGPQRETQ
jgi:hypothetical protein